jgi:hypothetical protein
MLETIQEQAPHDHLLVAASLGALFNGELLLA